MKPLIIYCFDAYAEWCYGFIPVMKKLEVRFGGIFDFEVLSGGLLQSSKPQPVSVIANHFLTSCPEVEAASGMLFGVDFLWHIKNPDKSDWFPDSLKPATALCIFKEYLVDQQVDFASDLGLALFSEGRDLCDDETYRHLLEKYNLPAEEFYFKLKSEVYKEEARQDFLTVKQLGVSGYPSLFIQLQPEKIIQITGSYLSFETVEQKLLELV